VRDRSDAVQPLDPGEHGIEAAVHPQRPEDGLHVVAHRDGADEKLACDITCGEAGRQQLQHFVLAGAQVIQAGLPAHQSR